MMRQGRYGLILAFSILTGGQGSSGALAEGAYEMAGDISGTAVSDMRVQVTPHDSTTLASELGARINALDLREGERFNKGDLLVTFDCAAQKATLAEAKASQHAAEVTVKANERLVQLRTIGNLEYQLSLADLEKSQAQVAAAEVVVDRCQILAPFDGRIVEQKAHAEQFVKPGDALLDVLDESVLEVEFVAPSAWINRLPVGTLAGVVLEETGKTYPVRISRIGARIDPVSQSIKMAATFTEAHQELIVGMSGYFIMPAIDNEPAQQQ
ncbi:efflux RND transporter periplasmic adaptor subunit [uncultured Cohaesibacter sp.]|uniref:efflux RND transporter periplasmic adaptor subunit n=1 Tax=uncultured Cohaesibacter sp. TaxID=1002546 RepID=UPI0029C82DF1|nr:efflux RND transporter periplasmic adaptor subunit [uncultured Cohaesibacter sp.]